MSILLITVMIARLEIMSDCSSRAFEVPKNCKSCQHYVEYVCSVFPDDMCLSLMKPILNVLEPPCGGKGWMPRRTRYEA